MIIHNVYFWLKPEVTEDQKAAFEQGIRNLISDVPGIHRAEFGTPAATSSRPVVDHSFDFSLVFQFKNIEDHDAYQVHPNHDVFVDAYKELWAKVQVFDSEMKLAG